MSTMHEPPDTKAQREELVKRIKFFLDQHGMTQTYLAEQLNTRPATISSWMQGHTFPGGRMIARLPSVLGVSPSWLYSGAGTPFAGDDVPDERSYQHGLADGKRVILERMRGVLAALESEVSRQETTAHGGGREESWKPS